MKKTSLGFNLLAWSFALDFKADEGGSVWQYLFTAIAFIGLLVQWLGQTRREVLVSWNHVLLWLAVVCWGFAMALATGAAPSQSSRVGLLFILALGGMVSANLELRAGVSIRELLVALVGPSLLSLVFRACYSVLVRGVALEDMRFQIISPALPFLIGYSTAAILFDPRLRFPVVLSAILSFSVVVISVTRSYIFTYLGIFVVLLVLYFRIDFQCRMKLFGHGFARKVISVGITCIIGVLITSVIRPDIGERWVDRIFRQDVDGKLEKDLTWITRQAEAAGMYEVLNKRPFGYIVGLGYGSEFYWAGQEIEELNATGMRFSEYEGTLWFSGHNMWRYALFSTGALGASIYAFVLIVPIFRFVKDAARRGFGLLVVSDGASIAPVLIAVAFMAQSYISNPFAERLACIQIGVCMSILWFQLATINAGDSSRVGSQRLT